MKQTIIAVLLAVTLISCQKKGLDGLPGKDGAPGVNGAPGPGEFIELNVEASRTYSPSTWQDGAVTLRAGLYELPTSIPVTSGNAGNGWLSIVVGDTRYCYQGAAPNATHLSDKFIYKGTVSSALQCFDKKPTLFSNVFFTDDIELELQVNGGGCSQLCQNTSVVVTIEGIEE